MAALRLIRGPRVHQPWQNVTNYLNFRSIRACNNSTLLVQSKSNTPTCKLCQSSVLIGCQSRNQSSLSPFGRRSGTAVTIAGTSGALGRWGQLISRSKYKAQDSDDEDSDYDSDQDDENFGPHFEEDEAFPDNYKELKKHVTSLRADAILGGGLNLARKKVDDHFLESKLLLNGEKVLKKSKQMEPGDCVDLITEMSDDTMKIKRVRLVKVAKKKSSKERHLIYLRAWRSNVSVPRDDSTKWSPR